jgi:uncharacterized OB-fold protein
MSTATDEGILRAPHSMEYAYRRSVGPVLSRFFTSLRDGKIEGNKTAAGRVLFPPMEYDPETAEDTSDEWVEVGPGGVVTSWTWIAEPRACHPSAVGFAYALVQLDGADVPFLNVVRADSEAAMSTGMRVTVQWADERTGLITDIAGFVPASS